MKQDCGIRRILANSQYSENSPPGGCGLVFKTYGAFKIILVWVAA